ncbi:MotA/TolQ/ExbB proton channel family protein [Luteolibacter pohnpeiensis]|uniref:MotA/TolQ/ExbB proton channel family protein n=1 Tax=Luteolibacter pohnpeiensis TaxID=454153 RepID=A0A934SAC4_9BACT|nr:MotA/TolQ/ExbB proton channel family protein [Luteolibacter pohnpeiensis]MBK1884204.1 MotA/TolQ/ExbB proton channel family protein [Luteolibacter pohnpeiensis]
MISRYFLTALLGVCSTSVFAQSPIDQARTDLQKSVQELGDTQREYSDLRRSLYRDINRLDDEALSLGKELRTLDREEEQRTSKIRSLEREVEARKTDFNYASGILNQYSKALVTRLHPAENQSYVSEIEALDQKAASLLDSPEEELAERAKVLEIGIDRIGSLTGGYEFDGKALRNGSEAVEGKLLVVGPSVFFASKDKEFEGVATFAETGTALPTVVGVEGSDGMIRDALAKGSGTLPLDGSMGKAIEVAAADESLMETIEKGGVVGHAILVLGSISLLIALFKIYEVSRFHVPSRSMMNAILDDLLSGNQAQALQKASAIPGQCGELVVAGVERFHEKRRVLEEALFEKLVTIKPILERFLPFLALTAAAAPLMGLLGTVLGIIKTFKAMALYGTGNAKSFSSGISEALITTAEGLVVAIPVLVIHGMLKSYVKGKFSDVEGVGITLVNGTTEKPSEKKKSEEPEEGDDDVELSPTLV